MMQTFDDLNLSQSLSRAIHDIGYTTPSPIQAQTLPILLGEPTDFIGLAATGTGKTAAFSIPLLSKLDPTRRTVQGLVMCPTRELCLQVSQQIDLLGKHMGVRALPIYGGAGYGDQLRGLRQGSHIVVGTPGRLIDHLERGTLKLDDVKVVVLDEADEMISMGFREDMETILKGTQRELSNIWLFSATMSAMVRKVANQFLQEPQMVQVNRTEMLSSTVEQSYIVTQESNKPEVLCKLIDAADDFYGLVFCQTKLLVVELTRYLSEHGYKTDCLHGDMSQNDREITVARFREKKVKIAVCTDVAARGLDVKDLTHVINFSVPREIDSYVHRIGRTARSGKAGFAISLVTPARRHLLGKIERVTKSRIVEGVIPSGKSIGAKKYKVVLAKLLDQKNHSRATDIMDEQWHNAVKDMSSTEVASRFLALMHPEVVADVVRPALERPAPGGRHFERGSRRGSEGSRDDRRGGDRRRNDRGGEHREEPRRQHGRPAGRRYGEQRFGDRRGGGRAQASHRGSR